jgi:hypothetical protein
LRQYHPRWLAWRNKGSFIRIMRHAMTTQTERLKIKNRKLKYLIYLTLLLFSTQTFSQTDKKLTGKPATLDETYLYLNQMFDDTAKYGFMTLPEDIAASRLHRGLGMWIRNNWGLWRNSELKQFFLDKGVGHPDDMSGIILTSYHRYLNSKPIDLDGQIKKYQDFYKGIVQRGDTIIYPKEFFEGRTPDSLLINYFPVGDTIRVGVYASDRKLFTTYASGTTATAIVKEHRKDKILVQIISMKNEPKKKPERKVGDIYEASLTSCSLIPPKGWTYIKK